MLVDQYPLPRPDDIWRKGGVYFSKLDLSQAYFQLELDEESQKLVTINTIQGLYRYMRLPFGLASAPAKFQQVMDNLLVGLSCVRAYLDDFVVFGDTEESMWKSVCAVLQRFKSASVRLQLSKCQFAVTKLPFLGHVIGKNGVQTDLEKIKAIQEARHTTSVSELLFSWTNNLLRKIYTALIIGVVSPKLTAEEGETLDVGREGRSGME